MGRRKKNSYIQVFFGLIIVVAFAIFGYDLNNKIEETPEIQEDVSTQVDNSNVTIQEDGSNLKIHYIDQTTPNMIQGLKGIFARKPLISIGI